MKFVPILTNLFKFRYLANNPKYLSILFLIIGLLGSLIPIFYLRSAFSIIYPLSVIVASLICVGFFYIDSPDEDYINKKIKIDYKIILTLYFLAVSTLIYLFYINGGERNIFVHGIIYLLYIFSICLIFTSRSHIISLTFFILTALITRSLIYFSSPIAYGADSHLHYFLSREVAQIGSIYPLSGSQYYYAPFYHIRGAMGTLILDLPVQDGTMFLIFTIVTVIVSSSLIYLIVSSYWKEEVGIFAVFLFLAGDQVIQGQVELQTTSAAFAFFALSIYSFVRLYNIPSKKWVGLFLILFIALSLTHQATTFITFMILLTFAIFSNIYTILKRYLITLSTIGGLIIFVDWSITKISAGDLFLNAILGRLFRDILLNIHGNGGGTSVSLPTDANLILRGPFDSLTLVHVLGLGILFGSAVIGCIIWLERREQGANRDLGFIFGVLIVNIHIIIMGRIIGINVFVPHRWWPHVYFLLAIVGGVGVMMMSEVIAEQFPSPIRTLLILVIIFSIPYMILMGVTAEGAIDQPIIDNAAGAERWSFTDKEVAKITYASTFASKNSAVRTDWRMSPSIGRYSENDKVVDSSPVGVEYESGSLITKEEDLIVGRNYMNSGNTAYVVDYEGMKFTVFGPNPLDETSLHNYNLIYTSEYDDYDSIRSGIYMKN